MATQPNYTEEQIETLHTMYAELGSEGIEQIAEALGKTVRSVRAKLVKDGLYVAPDKKAGEKANGPSKKELLRKFEERGFDPSGLEGATKEALARVLTLFQTSN